MTPACACSRSVVSDERRGARNDGKQLPRRISGMRGAFVPLRVCQSRSR